jgi:outer membrane lipoprotein-sorting protein
MMKKEAKMPKRLLASCLVLGLAVGWYAPEAGAVKVVRDPSISAVPQPPKVAQPAPTPPLDLPKLTAAQIAEKNVAARGGLEVWRAVQSITLSGKMEAGGKVDTYLPYTLQMKRPNKQRLAIEFAGKTALQVFDGQNGWKLRPYLNRPDPEPFSAEELSKTLEGQGFDGQLVDYAAKGNKVELEGTETVEGKATYRLKVTNTQGHANHIWIDGTTFLEAKIEGHPRRFDGTMRPVQTYLSDYRTVDGVKIPYVSETRVQGVTATHKMMIEKVAFNQKLDDSLFAKPGSAVLPPQRVFTVAPTASAANPGAVPPAAPQKPKAN